MFSTVANDCRQPIRFCSQFTTFIYVFHRAYTVNGHQCWMYCVHLYCIQCMLSEHSFTYSVLTVMFMHEHSFDISCISQTWTVVYVYACLYLKTTEWILENHQRYAPQSVHIKIGWSAELIHNVFIEVLIMAGKGSWMNRMRFLSAYGIYAHTLHIPIVRQSSIQWASN